MSDRLDDTLRAMAQAEAPADFPARVRVALETRPAPLTRWPTLAAAALVGVIAAGGWLVLSRPGGIMSRAGGTSVPPTSVRDTSVPPQDVRAGGTAVRAGGASVGAGGTSGGGTFVRAGGPFLSAVASAEAEVPRPSDHDRALPSLADITPVGPTSLGTDPVIVAATEVAPLTAIAAIDIPALDADGGERR